MLKKDLLFLTTVHGDEPDAKEALKKIEKQGKLGFSDYLVANPEALKINKRFVDVDMNRNAPGSVKSKKYESRRVKEILDIARDYKYVIDLHGSKGSQGVFTIIPKLTIESLMLALNLPIKKILIWLFNPNMYRGPIMKFIDCGVGIEFGPKETPEMKKAVRGVVEEIIKTKLAYDPVKIKEKEIYFVYEKVRKVENIKEYKDFQKVEKDGEEFYPIFVGAYKSIAFYKTRKIELEKILEIMTKGKK